jgi:hypothetical protein
MINNLAENNLIRFINISKKKDGMFANFRVKGVKSGTTFSASISVDILSAEIDIEEDSIVELIEACAKIAVSDFKKAEFQFEGLAAVAVPA